MSTAPPTKIGIEDIRGYFEYLATERSLSGASCRLFLHGIRFLYLQVLDWPGFDVEIPLPKKAQRIPELLTRAEVRRILTACAHPRHRMMLALCYGCGLRLSELVSLKVRDIDGERQLLGVEQGKGAKDRLFTQAKARAGVAKIGGIHGLRHAYATHQLEAGLPVHRLLGHQDIHSTLRYIHWVPDYREGCGVYDLIAALGVGHG